MKNLIPSLQSKIVKELAENGPATINEIKRMLGKDYRAVWFSVKSLLKKGLLEPVDIKEYRGRVFHRLWLSLDGALMALLLGAKPDKIRELGLKYLGFKDDVDRETFEFCIELAETYGADWLGGFIYPEKPFMVTASIVILTKPMTDDMLKILSKYPALKRYIWERAISGMLKLRKIIGKELSRSNFKSRLEKRDRFKTS